MFSDDGVSLMPEYDALTTLQAENVRLVALLDAHKIEWRLLPKPAPTILDIEPSRLSSIEKIALFRRIFRGRTDVYPVRWESQKTGKSGYAPACANEWRPGVCNKPRFSNRAKFPMEAIRELH